MQQDNYWTRIRRERVSRRQMLRGAAVGGVGLAGLALVGCGDDDDDDAAPVNDAADDTDAVADDAADQEDGGADAGDDADAAASDAPQRGGTFRWSSVSTPHLDIHKNDTNTSKEITGSAFDRLFRFNEQQVPEPNISTAFPEQPDETTLLFPILPGVTFHNKAPVNGREMVAGDVVFSLERARTDDPLFLHSADLASVDQIAAPDDATLRLTTHTADATLITNLTGYQFIIVAPETFDEFEDMRFAPANIGTGPFLIDDFSTDTGAKLTANPDYRVEGQPYLDGWEQLPIQDGWSQFLAGGVDMANIDADQVVGFESYADFLADSGVDAFSFENLGTSSAKGQFMNQDAPVFQDQRIRSALNLIQERGPQLEYMAPIDGRPSIAMGWGHGFFGLDAEEMSTLPGFRADREADIAAGLALLDEVGFNADNPLKFEMIAWSVPNRSVGIDQLQLGAETFKQSSNGAIEATPKGLEFGVWKQAEARGEYEMTASVYSMGPEPLTVLNKFYSSAGSRNWGHFRDETLDQMIMDARSLFNPDDMADAIRDMLRYVNDQERTSVVWIGTGPSKVAARAKIQGVPEGRIWDWSKIGRMWFA